MKDSFADLAIQIKNDLFSLIQRVFNWFKTINFAP